MALRDVVLVTGSSGMIGTALIRHLGTAYDIVGFDRMGPPHPPLNAECVEVDLISESSVERALDRVRRSFGDRIASVIHLAAYYDFSGAPSPLYEEITVKGTERLMRRLSSGFQVEQFVFSSTVLVHKPSPPGRRIDERWPLEPKWDYPASKARTEQLLRSVHRDLPLLILRIAGVYTDRCHSIPLAQQIRRMYENRLTSHFYPGDPGHGQPFVHLDDVVAALTLAIARRHRLPPEETLLIGEGETLGYGELQERMAELLFGEHWRTHVIPKPLAKLGAWIHDRVGEPFIKPWMVDLADDHYELDIGRARESLGWTPARSLAETLPLMVNALLEDPVEWYREHQLKLPLRLKRKAG